MPTNYVLIDFENVQPKNIDLLSNKPFKIYVFVGANQNKIAFELAEVMQKFGNNANYIKISGNGKNALDFHIAFYIGQLASQDPKGYFYIISKDTGFDPLIRHIKSKKIKAYRLKDLAEIPILRMSKSTNKDDKIAAIIKNLVDRGQAKPRKIKTLANTINSLFAQNLQEDELMVIIKELQNRKHIVLNKDNVSYKLPQLS